MINSYVCSTCKKVKPKAEFNQSKLRTKTGICKKCHSNYNTIRNQEKIINRNPDHYMECNTCFRMFNRFKWRGDVDSGDRITCVFCHSININKYV